MNSTAQTQDLARAIVPDDQYLTIAEAAKLIRLRQLSPVTLVEHCLKRIEALNGQLSAFIVVFAEEARSAALVAEREIAAGHWRGLLHGIPIGLKDNIYALEGPTTCNSAVLREHDPEQDATVVTRLREAGAIILGKLAMWEFATGGSAQDTPWPPARNPWDTSKSPNGSSSGPAVAVAAGLCLAAIGTDTGGSIRNPAAWCGVAGFKPTYGLISRHGVFPCSFSLDHVGPIAWTAADCEIVMEALAGNDPADTSSADYDLTTVTSHKPRIGVVRNYLSDGAGIDPWVSKAMDAAILVLEEAGLDVVEAEMAPLQDFLDVGVQLARSESYAVHEHLIKKQPDQYGELARGRILMGGLMRAADYVNAQRKRTLLRNSVEAMFREVDIVLLPSVRTVACRIEDDAVAALGTSFGRPFNVTGNPAISVNAGHSDEGLPVAVQLAGRPFEDRLVIMVASIIEQSLGARSRRPATGSPRTEI